MYTQRPDFRVLTAVDLICSAPIRSDSGGNGDGVTFCYALIIVSQPASHSGLFVVGACNILLRDGKGKLAYEPAHPARQRSSGNFGRFQPSNAQLARIPHFE
jgi:hypothetical protein